MDVNHLKIFELFFDYWNVKNTNIFEEVTSKLEAIWYFNC